MGMNGFELLGKAMRLITWKEQQEQEEKKKEEELAAADAMAAAEQAAAPAEDPTAPPPGEISTCMVLHSVFNAQTELSENGPDWADDIERDLREELQRHGTLTHFHMDRSLDSKGDIHVMYDNDSQTLSAAKTLHRRYYAGSQILVEFLVEEDYITKFELD